MDSVFHKWEISENEFTKIVGENPSLRGFVFGYVSEYKVRSYLAECAGITDIKKYDDHDRQTKGFLSFQYKGREFKAEVKSLQTNSVIRRAEGDWKGRFQCDASDKRNVILPNGHVVNTTCLTVGEFDIVAVSLFAFGDTWRFAFARNEDLPHPNRRAKNVEVEDREYLIKSMIDITWPLQAPFTDNLYELLDTIP